ncbi:triple tyrosine motif-containing protein [Stenotrophomonas aracearum]|jgi:signal transduction histidine kinase/ligand-binding sensor domain-containing protein|uniref:Triple tyrosine motif-containing protein n=1 Tax=Stenotrophomonas aracearum TaxID=3003272 RepID=A0ABY9YDJ7_9GAMM|nr:two-component regulator propeller domain-containing protein [Stenotrophomonas sp. A5588]WNH48955.1 triple tyrosine motif-containing protein [Stenotrophomonas sp. A5588]
MPWLPVRPASVHVTNWPLRGAVRILLCLALALTALSAQALSADRALSQLRHDRWTAEDGAPAQIFSIAQTPDGLLWIGSRQGLFRFDGVRFERITQAGGKALIDDDVLSLLAEPDGSVWVGYFSGGMSRLGGPHPSQYEYQRDDVPLGSVMAFARDAGKRLWAITPAALVWLDPDNDTWKTGEAMGFNPAWQPERMFADREGGLWIGYTHGDTFGIAYLAPHAARFAPYPKAVQIPYFDQAADGTVWAVDYWGARPLAHANPDPRHDRATLSWLDPGFKGAGVRFDRDGGMWLSTEGGIARVREASSLRAPGPGVTLPKPEYFGPAQGLTSEVVWTLFEDREGNVWAGTANGLDRFRDNALAAIALPRRDQSFVMAPGDGGRMLVGNADRGPMWVTPDPAAPNGGQVQELGGPTMGRVSALHRDASGTLWMGSATGWIAKVTATGLERVPLPPELAGDSVVTMIASDRAGGLWVSRLHGGLLRFFNGKWEAQNAKYGMQEGSTPRALAEDSQGRIWSDAGQTIRMFENGRKQDFNQGGPEIGRISALQYYGDTLWIGGARGVSMRANETFHRLLGRDGETFEKTNGIVLLPDGELWLGGRNGLTRVPAAEVLMWRKDPSHAVAFERFGVLDGLRGSSEQSGSLPSILADAQGRIWFATNRAVHWIDPRHIARNPSTAPLPPTLLGLQVDDKPAPLSPYLRLPAGSRDLRVDYTAPALRVPERVRFRYRLDGVDEEWREAGTRRQALYSRLEPGSYRFRVIASDDTGAWSKQEASFNVTVLPAFWQTAWFALAMLALGAVLVWLFVRWRVAVARQRMQRVYRARVGERERIARDLHDTLLQSVQALMLRIESSRRRLASGDTAAAETGLAKALEEAESGLVEGRDRIRELRRDEATGDDLEAAVNTLPALLELPAQVEFKLEVHGRPRRWRQPELGEVYRIVREAFANACRHASATHITVRVTYGLLRTTVEIDDDGCGIQDEVLAQGGAEGHWGLPGMRKRAALCGGTLDVQALPGGGTRVRLQLPRWRAGGGRRDD